MTKLTLKNVALTAFMAGAFVLPAAVNANANDWSKSDTSAKAGASTNVSQQDFAKADTDKSGTLSESEYSSFAKGQEKAGLDVASDFKDLDKNKDNNLTVAEFTAQKADGKGVNDNQ